MTLVEFLSPLKRAARRDQCLAVLYFYTRYGGQPAMTAPEVSLALQQARVPNARLVNVPDVLAKAGHFVDAPATNKGGVKLWKLTDSGLARVRKLLSLPEVDSKIEHETTTLTALLPTLVEPLIRSYAEEAMLCLSVGALRAAVVFLWSGAIRTMQQAALARGSSQLNAAIMRHDPKAKAVAKIEDFGAIRDATTILALREIGLIDKGQFQALEEALGFRNRCGHPTEYRPGIAKVSAYVEDVINIAFTRH